MNENNTIKSIINLYFGKHFSKYSRILFARWMNSATDSSQKWQAVEDLWKDTNATITEDTYESWAKLHSELDLENSQKRRFFLFNRKLLKYAAVGVLMVLTAGATYWITLQKTLAESPEMAEIFVPNGGESRKIVLPDGSTVLADAGSLLVYPKDFSKTKNRTVYLSGEAAFSVHKNRKQPFIVKTSHLNVQALGTVFTVEAYSDDSLSTTTLKEGSVLVSIPEGYIVPTVLKPNQQLIYSHKEHTATVQEVDASLYNMKRNGYLIFEHVSFDRLISTLERKFNVTIHYNSQKYIDAQYNVKFSPNEKLEDVLKILHELIGIKYTIENKVVIIN